MKHFPILQGRAYVVVLPEGAVEWFLTLKKDGLICRIPQQGIDALDKFENIPIPPGTWQIVGMLPEVTEEQAAGIVDYNEDIRYYRAYGVHPVESGDGKQSQLVGYLDAIKSLESAIHAEGYYLDENPLGNRPEMDASTDDDLDDFDFPNERGRKKWDEWEDEYKKWNEAQSCILDRSRCLLLGREDT